jgi:hypothetical protein
MSTKQADLEAKVISLRSAIDAVGRWHSHHDPPISGLFAIGVFCEKACVCVAVVSRPVARLLGNLPGVAEVTRLASDGTTRGAASFALRACVREAATRGYTRLVSYTLLGEVGASYRAARWRPTHVTRAGREWDTPSRRRKPVAQNGAKIRWEGGKDALPRNMEAWNTLLENAGKIALKTRDPSPQLDLFDGAKSQ